MTTVLSPGRLLGAAQTDLWAHAAEHGRVPHLPQDRLIEIVRDAGLTGRGGAGFPTHLKMAAVRRPAGDAIRRAAR